jgi:hypothetical protein
MCHSGDYLPKYERGKRGNRSRKVVGAEAQLRPAASVVVGESRGNNYHVVVIVRVAATAHGTRTAA